jgi:hypothetical protein
MDIDAAEALIVAVIPLHQVGIDFGRGSESCQFTGSDGTLQRAGEDLNEFQPLESLRKAASILFAVFR